MIEADEIHDLVVRRFACVFLCSLALGPVLHNFWVDSLHLIFFRLAAWVWNVLQSTCERFNSLIHTMFHTLTDYSFMRKHCFDSNLFISTWSLVSAFALRKWACDKAWPDSAYVTREPQQHFFMQLDFTAKQMPFHISSLSLSHLHECLFDPFLCWLFAGVSLTPPQHTRAGHSPHISHPRTSCLPLCSPMSWTRCISGGWRAWGVGHLSQRECQPSLPSSYLFSASFPSPTHSSV